MESLQALQQPHLLQPPANSTRCKRLFLAIIKTTLLLLSVETLFCLPVLLMFFRFSFCCSSCGFGNINSD
jgi:hypothetical protein